MLTIPCKYVINIYRQLNDISTADKYQTTLISILLRKSERDLKLPKMPYFQSAGRERERES